MVVQSEGPEEARERLLSALPLSRKVSENTLRVPGKWSKPGGEVLWMTVPPREGDEEEEGRRNIYHLEKCKGVKKFNREWLPA